MMGIDGFLDSADSRKVTGWLSPSENIANVDIFINDDFAARVRCDAPRSDLRNLGIRKDGLGGFVYEVELQAFDKVSVFCAESGAELNGSPRINQTSDFVSYKYFKRRHLSNLVGISQASLDGLVKTYMGNDPYIRVATNTFGRVSGVALANVPGFEDGIIVLRKSSRSIQRCIEAYEGFLRKFDGSYPKLLRGRHEYEGLLIFELLSGEVLRHNKVHRLVCEKDNSVIDGILVFLCDLNTCDKSQRRNHTASFLGSRKRVLLGSFRNLGRLKFREAVFVIRTMLRVNFAWRIFSHGDFHPENVLVKSDNSVYILDWDQYGFYPIGYDLACLLRNHDMYRNFEAYDAVVKEYSGRLNLSAQQEKALVFNFWACVYLFFVEHDWFRGGEQGRMILQKMGAL